MLRALPCQRVELLVASTAGTVTASALVEIGSSGGCAMGKDCAAGSKAMPHFAQWWQCGNVGRKAGSIVRSGSCIRAPPLHACTRQGRQPTRGRGVVFEIAPLLGSWWRIFSPGVRWARAAWRP
eukprot:353364-Chlamydomonas_euryale.AAC.2